MKAKYIILTETGKGNYNSLSVKTSEDGIKYKELNLDFKSVDTKKDIVIVNPKGNPIYDTLDYLNEYTKSKATKRNTATALIKLFQFITIFDISFEELANDNYYIRWLIIFLTKRNVDSDDIKMNFTNKINSNSSYIYFTKIQGYLRFKNIDKDSLIFEKNNTTKLSVSITNKALIKKQKSKGARIQDDEVARLYNYIKDKDIRLRAGITLELLKGMRIGTVLSLTEEDINFDLDEYGNISHYYIKVRNRLSNNSDQSVKTLAKIASEKDYKNKKKEIEDIDYHIYYISKDLYDLLYKVIKMNHKNSLSDKKKKQNYDTDAVADRVTNNLIPYSKNHYIFLNKQCKRLTAQNWNKHYLKPAFLAANISIDTQTKINGLNHKLRHTGMSMLAENGIVTNPVECLSFLKNKSLSTVDVYVNPSINNAIKIEAKTNEMLDRLTFNYEESNTMSDEEILLQKLEEIGNDD